MLTVSLYLINILKEVSATAFQSNIAALMGIPTLDLRTDQELLADLNVAEEGQAREITIKHDEQLRKKGYKTRAVVLEGGPVESFLMAAGRFNPGIIALEARG